MTQTVDLFVIGGGINGAGIARDAAGRGLSVILCEKDDLAQGTSSRSGKLVHGGLRFSEYYEFRLNGGQGNPSAVTRDYVFDLDRARAPMLNIFGGKVTPCRKLAGHALDRSAPFFPGVKPGWTARVPLPGGDMPGGDFDGYLATLQVAHRRLPTDLALHLVRLYGTRVGRVIGQARGLDALGRQLGPQFYEAEVRYLVGREMALRPEDIPQRRTKHGLHMTPVEIAALNDWFDSPAERDRRLA